MLLLSVCLGYRTHRIAEHDEAYKSLKLSNNVFCGCRKPEYFGPDALTESFLSRLNCFNYGELPRLVMIEVDEAVSIRTPGLSKSTCADLERVIGLKDLTIVSPIEEPIANSCLPQRNSLKSVTLIGPWVSLNHVQEFARLGVQEITIAGTSESHAINDDDIDRIQRKYPDVDFTRWPTSFSSQRLELEMNRGTSSSES